jgi:RimJ/RimL family protein N-acetyltransferase
VSIVATEAVAFRPLDRGERTAVLNVFHGLSERSRRQRFHGAKPRLSEREVDELVDVGCCGRHAVVAYERESGRAIGIARFVVDSHELAVAEVAYEVVDEWQGRGVGRGLAVELPRRANAEGVSRLRGLVDPANPPALGLLEHIGQVVERVYDGGALEVVVALRP